MKNTKHKFNFVEPKVIMSVVVALIILGVGVFAVFVVTNETNTELDEIMDVTSNVETFETDTNGSAPASDWYTYTDTGWEFANVTNQTGRGTSSNSFRVNDTTSGGGDYANFTFTTNDYDYFEMYFKWNNQTNFQNMTRSLFVDVDGAIIGGYNITGNATNITSSANNTVSFFNNTATGSDWAGKGGWNSTELTNDTWYRVRTDFNWSDNTIRGRLYSNAGTLLNDSNYINMSTGSLVSNNLKTLSITGLAANTSHIWYDDFTLYHSEIARYTDISTTANAVFNIIGIILIIGSILLIIGMASKYYRD